MIGRILKRRYNIPMDQSKKVKIVLPQEKKPKVRLKFVVTKREKYANKLYKTSDEQIAIADRLIGLAQELTDKRRYDDADKVIAITKSLLESNKYYSATVGEILAELK